MTRDRMTSRERMMTALNRQEPDHVPCSFMLFNGLKSACRDYAEFIERQVNMGLDACVELPPRPPLVVNDHYNLHGLPVTYDPRVTIQEWIEHPADEDWPIMVKEYSTPAGKLRAEVRQTADWPWGDHVPFLDDYIIPRSRKFLITEYNDLAALRFLLVPPGSAEVSTFREQSRQAQDLARRFGLVVAGGWGVGADLVGWVYGLEPMIFLVYDQPKMLREMLDIISTWNRSRMEVVLQAGVDLYVRRAWYENLDFWTPASWREYLCPILASEAELAHEWGAKFGYIITANCMPLLPVFAEVGIDVLIGVDPREWDLKAAKKTLDGRVALWGGVNGHITVEQGATDEVCEQVSTAFNILAPGGGFILSPVDNVREYTPTVQRNVSMLIQEWQRLSMDAA